MASTSTPPKRPGDIFELEPQASKLRMVGRGGSGSKLRQVSLSNPVVVLEPDPLCPRQPLDSSFYRPTGRGGLGSLSTSPPTPLKPLKSPTAILSLLRRRKRSDAQLHEQYQLHKVSPPRRPQSLYYHPREIHKDFYIITDSGHDTNPDQIQTVSDHDIDTQASESPITFAPPSIENAPHFQQTPTPISDANSSSLTTLPTREDSLPGSSSSSTPQLYVSTHSTSDAVPVANSDWLVPLNEVVISIGRTPSKPQSWTGEWNREIKDVIRDLRRL